MGEGKHRNSFLPSFHYRGDSLMTWVVVTCDTLLFDHVRLHAAAYPERRIWQNASLFVQCWFFWTFPHPLPDPGKILEDMNAHEWYWHLWLVMSYHVTKSGGSSLSKKKDMELTFCGHTNTQTYGRDSPSHQPDFLSNLSNNYFVSLFNFCFDLFFGSVSLSFCFY